MGFGLQEKYYQRAYEKELQALKIPYNKEYKIDLTYNGDKIGTYFLDFLIDNKIIVEMKVIPVVKNIHVKQVLEYLKVTNLKLAILIYFTKEGIQYKRVINPNI